MAKSKFLVIRDTREKKGWTFGSSDVCYGTKLEALKTGDYSISGLENVFTIERKGSILEFAQNILEKRFEDELDRMDGFPYAYLVLEFTMDDIMNFPNGLKLPPRLKRKICITSSFILKKLMEIMVNHKVKVILCGRHGSNVATSIFKRMIERVQR